MAKGIRLSPEMVISTVLSVAVVIGLFMHAPTELMTGLVSGLVGYLGRQAQDSIVKPATLEQAVVEKAVAEVLKKQGMSGNLSDALAAAAIEAATKKKEGK